MNYLRKGGYVRVNSCIINSASCGIWMLLKLSYVINNVWQIGSQSLCFIVICK